VREKSYGKWDMPTALAKQSQFVSPWAGKTIGQAKGLDAATLHRDNCAKQSQFPAQGVWYKQTQFSPGGQEGQVSCGKGVMVNWTCTRRRKNKANWEAV
jgi:hypothetical protein